MSNAVSFSDDAAPASRRLSASGMNRKESTSVIEPMEATATRAVVEIVKVEFTAAPLTTTVVGAKLQLAPLGRPLQDRLTFPL